jgi:hypothetical protein
MRYNNHLIPVRIAVIKRKIANVDKDIKKKELGTVAQACNPSYSGDGNREVYSSRLAWAKKSPDPTSTNKS